MTLFFEPIIKWLWGLIVQVSAFTFDGFISFVYQNAAMGKRNYIDVLFFMFIATAAIVYIIENTIKVNPIQKNDKKSVNKTSGAHKENTAPKKKLLNFNYAVFYLSAAVMVILILFLTVSVFSELQLNTSFEQRLTVLAPVISEQENKEIKASWASMKNREDFLTINAKMENLAGQNNIVLPKLLLP